jgi:putative sigma-54 modulation protein
MHITLSGHHVDITDALRDYVTEKLEKIERHFDKITGAQVILSIEKLTHKVEATLYVAGNDLFADAEHEDMYAAIDALSDKLDRQVKKHKDKINAKKRQEKPRDYSA